MSGHSHWATIKRKKEATDQARGKLFSKLSREIMLAIAQGGGITDPDKNVRLRAAIAKAKEINMPKDNIERLLKRIEERTEVMTEMVYEALGPDPVTFIIKTATDNPRRTQTAIKVLLDKHGGKLVEKGAVMYNYDLLGMFTLTEVEESRLFSLLEAVGALDFENDDDTYYVYVAYDQIAKAWQQFKDQGFSKAPELVYKPKLTLEVSPEKANQALRMVELLEELDEVQEVYFNIKPPLVLP